MSQKLRAALNDVTTLNDKNDKNEAIIFGGDLTDSDVTVIISYFGKY